MSHSLGNAGEHLVCFESFYYGYQAVMVEYLTQYDVLLFDKGTPFKIQVKTSSRTRTEGKSFKYCIKTYNMHKEKIKGGYKERNVDIFACVHPELRKIAYIPYDQVRTNWEITITPDDYDNLTLKSALFFLQNEL
ncbi:MAG: hypothetical protein CMP21_08915 [Rickettsiales bacterium]|nr:hypothetical protein [Rickettsiales bacterium]|tara:strand:- start:3803 stop:4207 length:405 start_codon:yes stop_codon:yes gene_type:complete